MCRCGNYDKVLFSVSLYVGALGLSSPWWKVRRIVVFALVSFLHCLMRCHSRGTDRRLKVVMEVRMLEALAVECDVFGVIGSMRE
jgi:hypothetical protein